VNKPSEVPFYEERCYCCSFLLMGDTQWLSLVLAYIQVRNW